ncbi:MAG: hypothetical protein H0T89_20370, partial [Deltaproteobacteria bacterium]|nr:hypothetical protein [Deltaproteobacteria bacterium]
MPPRVHLAVLSIADPSVTADVLMENIVADRAVAAGHHIAAFTTVRDNEVAIRAQLVGLIMDPDIDVVIVVGEGEATSRALAPLVDQALPGFADLLRMLAFQEIGASAMLSSAEAARCESTFVFVLPAGENAVSAAMDKLILPQLDPQTRPRNLIDSIPRLRDATKVDRAPEEVTRTDVTKRAGSNAEVTRVDAVTMPDVPVAIAADKTTSGPGLAPKPPAVAPRTRSRTGANVVVRKVEDPTKPIELAKLEQQIAMSQTTGDATRPMDLSKLSASTEITKSTELRTAPAADKPAPATDDQDRIARAFGTQRSARAAEASRPARPRTDAATPPYPHPVTPSAATSHPASDAAPRTGPHVAPRPLSVPPVTASRTVPNITPQPGSRPVPHAAPPSRPASKTGPHAAPPSRPASKTGPHAAPLARPVSKTGPHAAPPPPVAKSGSQAMPVAAPAARSGPHGVPTAAIPAAPKPAAASAPVPAPVRERSPTSPPAPVPVAELALPPKPAPLPEPAPQPEPA